MQNSHRRVFHPRFLQPRIKHDIRHYSFPMWQPEKQSIGETVASLLASRYGTRHEGYRVVFSDVCVEGWGQGVSSPGAVLLLKLKHFYQIGAACPNGMDGDSDLVQVTFKSWEATNFSHSTP